jgi:Putative MetA-pathway of phenol degradation
MKIILLVAITMCYSFAFSQTITTDRPTQTTGATTVEKGIFQVETGLVLTTNAGGPGYVAMPNLFRLGVGKKFELRFVNGFTFQQKPNKIQTSINNFELGFKAELLNKPEGKTQIGLIFHGITSTGFNKFENGLKGTSLTFAFNHQFNPKNALSYNFGYSLFAQGQFGQANIRHNALFTLNYSHSFTNRLGLFTELYAGVNRLANFDEDNIYANLDLGITYLLRDNIQLDYSFGFGGLDRMNFHSIGISFYIDPKK